MIEFARAADAAAPAAQQPNALYGLVPWIMVFGVMYLLLWRPQRAAEKKRQTVISELKPGDRVLLVSGFYARVVKSGEHIFTVELGKGLQVEIDHNAIASKVEPAAPAAAGK